jgi:hypothetical protein
METTRPSPTPLLPPPPGQTSNFENPESLTQQFSIGTGIVVPLVTIFVGLRVYSRFWIRKVWILEDWFVVAAWAGTIVLAGAGSSTMAHHGGKHAWDITAEQANEASYWFNVCSIEFGIALFFAKVAVLQLYRRVFSPHRWGFFDLCILSLSAIIFGFHTATTIVKIFECDPREKIYNPKIEGKCVDIPMLLTSIGIFNLATDIIILLLPVKAVWIMNLPLKKKTIVVLVFTFGLAAPAFSLVGFVVRIKGNSNPDKNWVQPDIIMWGMLEIATAVLCASFPEIGPVFIKSKKRTGPTTSIVKGRYRYDDSGGRRKHGAGAQQFSSRISKGMRNLESDPYIELEEGQSYDVRTTAQSQHGASTDTDAQGERPRDITITKEVRVHSRTAL